MESWVRGIFLNIVGCGLAMLSFSVCAQEAAGSPDEPPQVIDPNVERRDLDIGAIDTENFELTGFFGLMAVEDFEANIVYGARLAYHISESFFLEGTYGLTEVGENTLERNSPVVLLTDRELSYYDLSLAWNILPSESFFGSRRAFNSSLYLIGGLGSVDFADDSSFAVNFGFGFKVLLTDSFAARLEARNYLFDSDVTGPEKTLNNMQGTLNFSWFF